MPAARDDYLLRQIQQTAAALKSLIARIGDGESADAIIADITTAIATLLGPQRALLERLDGWSAAHLLGDPDRVQLWSELLALLADTQRRAGRDAVADRVAARAKSLSAHGVSRPS